MAKFATAADVTESTNPPRLEGPWSARVVPAPIAHMALAKALSATGTDPPLLSLRVKRRVVVLPEVEMEDDSRAWAGSTTT